MPVVLISATAMRAATDPEMAVLWIAAPLARVTVVVDGGTRSSWVAVLDCMLASLGVAAWGDIGAAPLTSRGPGAVYARRGHLWSSLLTIS